VLILLVMTLVGLPLAHILFQRLPSRGYLLAKPLGLLAFSFVSWLLLFTGVFTNGRSYLMLVLIVLVLAALLAYSRLPGLTTELRARGWQIILGEAVFAVAFLLFALYRARNPDIAGTEKPMEFAMLNSVMRSATFPPMDPWLSGLPVNYYYFGYSIGGALANLGHPAGISILPTGSGPLYTNTPFRTPDVFIARYSAPDSRQSGAALDVEPTEAPAFRAFLRHRSTRMLRLLQADFVAVAARQPAGTGSAQILRSMSPNSRLVRCPSARRSQ